jgi:class 3 adenylate cyclase
VPVALRAYLRLEAGEAEHRQVTAGFLKFTGIEALLAQGGPAAVNEPLAALGALVGRVTSELGITLLESDIDVDGGKLYLTAGAPSSTGADEERMLRAMRAILDAQSPLTLRAGVNRGPAFAGDIGASTGRAYAVMGDTVNLAARLTARAQLGEILATAEVLERSRTTFETVSQPFLVKGKERAITACNVGAVTGLAEEEAQQVLPIVGRDEEVQELRTALESARLRRPSHGARRRAGHRQVAPRRGAEDDGTRLHPALHSLQRVRGLGSVLPVPLLAATAGRDHRDRERVRRRRQAGAVGRGGHARVRALAPRCWPPRSTPRFPRPRRARRSGRASVASASSRRSSSSSTAC